MTNIMTPSILNFAEKKSNHTPIAMVTAYTSSDAQIVNDSEIDAILVGDSVAMVVHGFASTLSATVEMMILHTAAVARGAPLKLIVADMPFLSFRKGPIAALECVDSLMKAGAHAVKLEGVEGHEETITAIVESGVPVMGHLGLTPQSVNQLGGYRVQGKRPEAAEKLMQQALKLQELGAFAVVLECVPAALAREISTELRIPTIGIGAGPETDGQILVWQDLLGWPAAHRPKFVRTYAHAGEFFKPALNNFVEDVRARRFPNPQESYL